MPNDIQPKEGLTLTEIVLFWSSYCRADKVYEALTEQASSFYNPQ